MGCETSTIKHETASRTPQKEYRNHVYLRTSLTEEKPTKRFNTQTIDMSLCFLEQSIASNDLEEHFSFKGSRRGTITTDSMTESSKSKLHETTLDHICKEALAKLGMNSMSDFGDSELSVFSSESRITLSDIQSLRN